MTQRASTPSILLVDDDQLVLSSLRGLLRLETEYDFIESSDPLDALRQVERRPVDLVISDFMMPRMNGVDLLKKVKSIQPRGARPVDGLRG